MLDLPQHHPTVAYFSMEVGLAPAIPTYAGGLGVLAADTLRAAADVGLPMVGITLLQPSISAATSPPGSPNANSTSDSASARATASAFVTISALRWMLDES